jgi:ankyrin repeat protein
MGVDLDETGSSDLTILHRAVLSGHEDLIEPLIVAGADVNANSDDFGTPLCLAALKGMDVVVKILLKYRAKADTTTKKVGTALHCSIMSVGDHKATIMALMDAGALLITQSTLDTRWLQVICEWDGDDRTRMSSPQHVDGCILYDATPAFVAVRSLQDHLLETLLPPDLNHAFQIESQVVEGTGKPESTSHLIRRLQTLEDESDEFKSLRHTYLSSCATNGSLNGVKLLIEQGVNLKFDHGTVVVPLMTAAIRGHTGITALLLESGASVHETNSEGSTALHCAAIGGNSNLIRLLCERGATVDAQTSSGNTALHNAASGGFHDIVDLLCERGATVDMKDMLHATPLHYAAGKDEDEATDGHRQVFSILCERGATIDAQTDEGSTALHYAASKGYYDIACLLCEHGAMMDMKDNDGWAALHYAARHGTREVVRLLCERGATVDIRGAKGHTALHAAVERGSHQIVRTLCELGAAVDARNKFGCTPLWRAALRDFSSCGDAWHLFRVLIDAGADINARSHHGETPLLVMLANNDDIDLAILGKLIQAGAETSARNHEGLSVLRLCFTKPFAREVITTIGKELAFEGAITDRVYTQLKTVCGKLDVPGQREQMLVHGLARTGRDELRLALALGADIDIKGIEDGTAMHWAARWNDCDAIDRLLAADASLEFSGYKGRTPLAVAVRYKSTRAVKRLIRHGSDPHIRGAKRGAQSAMYLATKQRGHTILGILEGAASMSHSSGSEMADLSDIPRVPRS